MYGKEGKAFHVSRYGGMGDKEVKEDNAKGCQFFPMIPASLYLRPQWWRNFPCNVWIPLSSFHEPVLLRKVKSCNSKQSLHLGNLSLEFHGAEMHWGGWGEKQRRKAAPAPPHPIACQLKLLEVKSCPKTSIGIVTCTPSLEMGSCCIVKTGFGFGGSEILLLGTIGVHQALSDLHCWS